MAEVISVFDVPAKGIGKPDYTRIVTAAKERRGLYLEYGQTLKIFSLAWAPSPVGAHTGGPNLTVMTDALAAFVANELIGLIIVNVTDGSYGIVIANTVNTVTVAVLLGGVTNQWNFGNIYSVGGAYSWISSPLVPGGIQHIIDTDTGLATPFTVPQGYTMALIAVGAGITEDAAARGFMDGLFILPLGVFPAGSYFENKLTGMNTAQIDPTGLTSHTIDLIVTNRGAGNLEGTIDYVCILERVGSPPLPTVKTVKCKWCGHEHEVPNETTNIICSKCGKLFIVYDNTKLRRTP